jgi:hypothetical protein
MINDDERDYAEERANLADMRREQESEAEFERVHALVVEALRAHSADAAGSARLTLDRIGEELSHRLPVNSHRVELLTRQQYEAHLASALAVAVEAYTGYDLVGAADAASTAWLLTHSTGRDDVLGRACRTARSLVLRTAQTVVDDAELRETDAREQADRDETEAYLRRVTR